QKPMNLHANNPDYGKTDKDVKVDITDGKIVNILPLQPHNPTFSQTLTSKTFTYTFPFINPSTQLSDHQLSYDRSKIHQLQFLLATQRNRQRKYLETASGECNGASANVLEAEILNLQKCTQGWIKEMDRIKRKRMETAKSLVG
ncbi:MAG: hypothetical protein Q9224_007492, partial [Gallowayella concinna]